MHSRLDALRDGAAFDLIVLGAGGAGLSAALHAAIDGARVLVVESTEFVGGTTALSAGTTWIPCSPHARAEDGDSLARAASYLDQVVGEHSPRALRQALLEHGAQAVQRFEAHTDVHYRAYAMHPDYESDVEGAVLRGRALEPWPFDGRQLGALFALIRPPIPEFTVLGGMMVDRTDIQHLLAMGRSWTSLRHAARILARHAADRLRHPRGTRLVMGNALVARLLFSLSKRSNVTLLTRTRATTLQRAADGAVVGVALVQDGVTRAMRAQGGVVLASGGFNRHAQARGELLPGMPPSWCPGAPGHTGEAQDLALGLGARRGNGAASHAFWAPVSLRRRADGSTAVFPHFVMDRAKPGTVVVDRVGRRFVNESTSYHRFGLAMLSPAHRAEAIPAFLVADAQALHRYGLGMVRPGGRGLGPYLADGYLTRGDTLESLAGQLGIDATNLRQTVETMNAHAAAGTDPDFGRGRTAYQRNLGDATCDARNPNLGPIVHAPFYAVKLFPGDIGAATGLATDDRARVLDERGLAIAGLYAVGNDMQSVMGGAYPGPGITIGPGMVFAFLAAQDALARAPGAGAAA